MRLTRGIGRFIIVVLRDHRCFERHWPTFSGGLILVVLTSRNHFGKKEKVNEKEKIAFPFFYSFFPFLFFLIQAFNSYPA